MVPLIAHKSLYNMIHAKMPKVCVGLPTAYKQNRLACNICHGQRGSDLVVLRVSGAKSRLTMVSNLVRTIPSMPRLRCAPPALEKSFKDRSNLVN